jgi:phage shock protein A
MAVEQHFTTVRRFLKMAEEESRGLQERLDRQDVEMHKARRKVEQVQRENVRLQARISQLEREREQALHRAGAAIRAVSEHAGRVA